MDTLPMGPIHVFHIYAFGIAMDTPRMSLLAQKILLETWEHDTQRVQGLGNYNIHSLIWLKVPRQRTGQGGVASLTKMELDKYVHIDHKQ